MSDEDRHDELLEEMTRHLVDQQLPCTAAHTIAHFLGLSSRSVGLRATEDGIRISQCQLGLFGYGPKSEGKSKLVRTVNKVPAPLQEVLGDCPKGEVSCARCWEIAAEMGVERLAVSEAAESLGLRLVSCQLGCF